MEIYNIMFYGGFALAALFFILTIVLFFVLKIPKAFGVVTGSTERKAIEEIRAGGSQGGKRGKGGNIKARDIQVSSGVLEKSSSLKNNSNHKNSSRLGDSSDDAKKKAEKVAEAARLEAARAAAASIRQQKNNSSNLPPTDSEQATEVLTYQEMKKREESEAPTSVLGNVNYSTNPDSEESTDVLRADGSSETAGGNDLYNDYNANESTDVLTSGDIDSIDESTDVLTSGDVGSVDESTDVLTSDMGQGSIEESTDVLTSNYDSAEDATDVLRNSGNGYDEGATDVLTSDEESIGDELLGSSAEHIYGTVSAETTSVLATDYTPDEEISYNTNSKIKVLYSETITHTDETL